MWKRYWSWGRFILACIDQALQLQQLLLRYPYVMISRHHPYKLLDQQPPDGLLHYYENWRWMRYHRPRMLSHGWQSQLISCSEVILLLPQAAWSKALHPASILRSVCLADIMNQPRSSFSETRITGILIMNSSISELLNPHQSWSLCPGIFPFTFVLSTFKHTGGSGTKTPCADHRESPIGKQELMWARRNSCKVLWDEFVELLVQWDINMCKTMIR
jgi:hypothetical protein